MARISTDQVHLLKDLADYFETVEIWDENDKLIGVFVPANLGRAKRVYAEAVARTDFAELARRAAEPGPRRAPSEVLQELEAKYGAASSNGTPVSEPASAESRSW